ncbi:MAG: MoxR family ATPase, partial [Bacteroidota bacterium]
MNAPDTDPIKYYTGDALRNKRYKFVDPNDPGKEITVDPYIPSEKLVEAVKLAQILKRPLLLEGEPGCGKSRLAEAIAFEFHGENFKKFYFEWNIKSTSKAGDGLYTIDHLRRLRDASIVNKTQNNVDQQSNNPKHTFELEYPGDYINLGELGKAFEISTTVAMDKPPVVLIDEIDKADIDFPNDLLMELDKMQFVITETKDKTRIVAKKKPLIIITSNHEKSLPQAFLRRCLFHYVNFPEPKDLSDIIRAHFEGIDEDIVSNSVSSFFAMREYIKGRAISNKNINTSELIDWVRIIYHYKKEGRQMNWPVEGKTGTPEHMQALLKDLETIQTFLEMPKNDKEAAKLK